MTTLKEKRDDKLYKCPICKNEYCSLEETYYKEKDVKQAIKNLNPKLFHDTYEEEAEKLGWETQKKCRVKFDDLPELNQETMINTIRIIKNKIFGEELTK